MTGVRRACTTLQKVAPRPALPEREARARGPGEEALDWQGSVRVAADRAGGISASAWHAHVRTGLLERVVSLGADQWESPHRMRPEIGRRLLAHLDALGEAGLSPEELSSFAGEQEIDRPGAVWALSLLFACLDAPGAEEALEVWVASLDVASSLSYRPVVEVAEALACAPGGPRKDRVKQWISGRSAVLVAVGIELSSLDEAADGPLDRWLEAEDPVVLAALERLIGRSPRGVRSLPPRPSWLKIAPPAFAFEAARARSWGRDPEPLARLRLGEARAFDALGPYAMDVLALGCDTGDGELACELARALPGTPELLSAMGRVGLPSLFPRLLSELQGEDLNEDAHEALVTALGPRSARPIATTWEEAIRRSQGALDGARLRGGEPHSPRAVLGEARRPDLSACEVAARADELFAMAGSAAPVQWGAWGASLEGVLSELARLVR